MRPDIHGWRQLRRSLLLIMLGALILWALGRYVLPVNTIDGPSMSPTLQDGDHTIGVAHRRVRRGSIVVLQAPDRKTALYVKRVVGLPGDRIESRHDVLYVNGHKSTQPYLNHDFVMAELDDYAKANALNRSTLYFTQDFSLTTLHATHTTRVPAGHYFVLGDNRYISHDSRAFGFIDQDAVKSVVTVRFWPLSSWHWF